MQATYDDFTRSRSDRGPALYYGYCGRTRRYRMMDLPDYMSNMQQGMTRWMSDPAAMYQEIARGYSNPAGGPARSAPDAHDSDHDCGCHGRGGCDCHCECCVCDADVLVHARCSEMRSIPVTFENDTRRRQAGEARAREVPHRRRQGPRMERAAVGNRVHAAVRATSTRSRLTVQVQLRDDSAAAIRSRTPQPAPPTPCREPQGDAGSVRSGVCHAACRRLPDPPGRDRRGRAPR